MFYVHKADVVADITSVFFCTKPVMCECLAGGRTPDTCRPAVELLTGQTR